MRFRDLRRALQHIVLVGLPAGGCSVVDAVTPGSDPCYTVVEKSFLVSGLSDAPLRLRLESCRLDVDACPELCAIVMQRAGVGATAEVCDVTFDGDDAAVKVQYTVSTNASNCASEGRRPPGLQPPSGLEAIDLAGAWLAQAAWLEAASVPAFLHLARELRALGAPEGLVRGALAAAEDEVRHTAVVTALAHRYGARPPRAQVSLPPVRGLEDIAIENAAEGCVRETFGAVLALWQSHTAADPKVRAAFRVIARDEARHAALAWAIDRWVTPRLSAEALARVAVARQAAICQLRDTESAHAIVALGLPSSEQARGLVARACSSLWTGNQGGYS